MNKKWLLTISALALGSLSVANAAPIAVSFDSLGLSDAPAGVQIWDQNGEQMIASVTKHTIDVRNRPALGNDTMATLSDVTMSMPMGQTHTVSAATGVPPAAAGGGNQVVVVGEPGILLLTGLGLILAGVARRRS